MAKLEIKNEKINIFGGINSFWTKLTPKKSPEAAPSTALHSFTFLHIDHTLYNFSSRLIIFAFFAHIFVFLHYLCGKIANHEIPYWHPRLQNHPHERLLLCGQDSLALQTHQGRAILFPQSPT